MTTPAYDLQKPAKDHPTETLAKRVAAVQERGRDEEFVSDGSDNKPFMDEMWGGERRLGGPM